MSFHWYRALKALFIKDGDAEERSSADDEPRCTTRTAGSPYRHSDEQPAAGPETVEEDFPAVFTSCDGTRFTCVATAVFIAISKSMATREVRYRVYGCLSDRLRRVSRMNGGTEILAVIRDFVRIVCVGRDRLPDAVMDSLPDGVCLSDVRLREVVVDSGVGRPIHFRFDR